MPREMIVWLPVLGIVTLLGACGSDGLGSSMAAVQEQIDRCNDDFASCDGSSEDCEAGAMRCMNGVHGNGVHRDDIAEHCDTLYDSCSTKTEDLAFCEDLRKSCFDCVDRYDGDDDGQDDNDDDGDDDSDGNHDDDGDRDDDDDRCDRDHHDDDDDDRDDNDDDDYGDDDDHDCDDDGTGGAGGTAGAGGTGGTAGAGGTGGTAGAGGTGGTAGAGGGAMGVSFAADIQPYFEADQADCVRCHSGGSGPKGVNLDSYASILAGGDGFSLVVPGDSSDPSAALVPQLNANHLNGPDDAGFVLILSRWIDEGAIDN